MNKRPKNWTDDRRTEDEIAREKLGPRGIPDEPVRDKLTPEQRKEQLPVGERNDGHTA